MFPRNRRSILDPVSLDVRDKRHFLFLGRNPEFMRSIIFSTYYTLAAKGSVPRELLYGVDGGVVLVGPQTSRNNPELAVFPDYRSYFNLLNSAGQDKLPIAAVLKEGFTLPGQTGKIDRIIFSETAGGTKMYVSDIGRALMEFFQPANRQVNRQKTVERIGLHLRTEVGSVGAYGKLVNKFADSIADLLQDVFGATPTRNSPPTSAYSGLETLAGSSEYVVAQGCGSVWVGKVDVGNLAEGNDIYDVGILFQETGDSRVREGSHYEFGKFQQEVVYFITQILHGLATVQALPLSRKVSRADDALAIKINEELINKTHIREIAGLWPK